MVERAIVEDGQTTQGPAYWLSIEIQPRRLLLFRRWARHLGLSDADLAAALFIAGTLQLGTHDMAGAPMPHFLATNQQHVDSLLDELQEYLDSAPRFEGGPDAPSHH